MSSRAFVDELSLTDFYASLERAARVLKQRLMGCSERDRDRRASSFIRTVRLYSDAERIGLNSSFSPPRSANLPRPSTAGAFSVQGKSMFLTFAYGVMYVLSFATIITVFATTIALAVLLMMMACRSIWRLLRRRSIP